MVKSPHADFGFELGFSSSALHNDVVMQDGVSVFQEPKEAFARLGSHMQKSMEEFIAQDAELSAYLDEVKRCADLSAQMINEEIISHYAELSDDEFEDANISEGLRGAVVRHKVRAEKKAAA